MISQTWIARRTIVQEHAQLVAENNFLAALLAMRNRVARWMDRQLEIQATLLELQKKCVKDPSSVTAEDFHRAADGANLERLFPNFCTRKKWPKGVPYLNLVALHHYYLRVKEEHRATLKTKTLKELFLMALEDPYGPDVTVEAWEEAAQGMDVKDIFNLVPDVEDLWPRGVPYLNMVALARHQKLREAIKAMTKSGRGNELDNNEETSEIERGFGDAGVDGREDE
ncbi:hypothetical protein K505DRAFT_368798 [Melanomma pulvis-pyrius CBS 109.77]|uniref:Uncharacterized protein n=1 Tax=Melanomma pulvis-pyrius CBS 109.77 TaxID=1314802 RepID=A0A6A6WNW9_9PLEO|nr:hypothetical protein K505DRAFT_368798 [Melanomma pulvis-pyrius CBS 109.77]